MIVPSVHGQFGRHGQRSQFSAEAKDIRISRQIVYFLGHSEGISCALVVVEARMVVRVQTYS